MGRSFFSRFVASEGRARSATAGSRSHPYPVLRLVPPRGAATPRHVSVRRAALTSPRAYYILEQRLESDRNRTCVTYIDSTSR